MKTGRITRTAVDIVSARGRGKNNHTRTTTSRCQTRKTRLSRIEIGSLHNRRACLPYTRRITVARDFRVFLSSVILLSSTVFPAKMHVDFHNCCGAPQICEIREEGAPLALTRVPCRSTWHGSESMTHQTKMTCQLSPFLFEVDIHCQVPHVAKATNQS